MLDRFLDLISDSPWTYGVVFLFAMLDAIIPIVPSETAVVTAGALSASGDLHLPLIILLAAAGAIAGDNIAYLIGRCFKGFVHDRLFRGSRRRHLDKAQRALLERGGYLIIIGRFIPGGRTAVAFASGALRYPWPRFLLWDVAAGLIWATYSGMIGYVGGTAFEDNPLYGILLALGIAFSVAGAIEGFRWWKRRRRSQAGGPADPAVAAPNAPAPGSRGDSGEDRG